MSTTRALSRQPVLIVLAACRCLPVRRGSGVGGLGSTFGSVGSIGVGARARYKEMEARVGVGAEQRMNERAVMIEHSYLVPILLGVRRKIQHIANGRRK